MKVVLFLREYWWLHLWQKCVGARFEVAIQTSIPSTRAMWRVLPWLQGCKPLLYKWNLRPYDFSEESSIIDIHLCKNSLQTSNPSTPPTIISEEIDYLKSMNYLAIRLAWVKGNPQAEHFWLKNGFSAIKETSSTAADYVILSEKKL